MQRAEDKLYHATICWGPLDVNGKPFEIVKSAKVLEMTVTNDLKWNEHVSNTVEKASKRFYLLKQLNLAEVETRREYVLMIYGIVSPSYQVEQHSCIATIIVRDVCNFVRRVVEKHGNSLFHTTNILSTVFRSTFVLHYIRVAVGFAINYWCH